MDCEKVSCYCKRHPEKNNGGVHKVFDNETGKTIRMCTIALRNDLGILECQYCYRLMISAGIKIPDIGGACVKCHSGIDLLGLCATVYPDPEERIQLDLEDESSVEKSEKDRTYDILEELNERPDGKEALFKAIHASITTKRNEKAAAKQAASSGPIAQAKAYANTRKRVLSKFMPIACNLTPRQFLECVPIKCTRFLNDSHREMLDSLCNESMLSESETVSVIQFLFGQPITQ